MVANRIQTLNTESLEGEEEESDKQKEGIMSTLVNSGKKDIPQSGDAMPFSNKLNNDTEDKEKEKIDDGVRDEHTENDMNTEASSNVSCEETVWGDDQIIYMHAPWPSDQTCFVCNKQAGKIVSCERRIGAMPCPIVFHEKCVRSYNAGMFSYDYLLKKEEKRSCPLHHCSYCFQNRLKSTAVYFDAPEQNIVSCEKCLQSFHECCRPAGSSVEIKMLIQGNPKSKSKTCICPQHAVEIEKYDAKRFPDFASSNFKKKQKFHLNICTECEETEGDMMYCSNCIRAYHPKCHRFQKVMGKDSNINARSLCESCLIGDFVRHKSVAIARYNDNSFYACTTVDTSSYPIGSRKQDRYGRYLGKPGFVVVQWGGCDNYFACLPITQVIPMFCGAYEKYGKNKIKNPHYKEAFYEMSKEPPFRKAVPPTCQYSAIETSVYAPGCAPRFTFLDEEDVFCNCSEDDINRCGTDNCHTRLSGWECPEECETNSRICNNRSITTRKIADGIVKKHSGLKGYGVFATKKIMKGSVIAEYAGELISSSEKQRRIETTQRNANNDEHHYMMDLDAHRTIDCKNKGNIGRFINHSCEPNCTTTIVKIHVETINRGKNKKYKMDDRVAIIAARDIKPDEELCFNYRMAEQPGSQLPDCLCGNSTCTGKMGKVGSGNRKPVEGIKPRKKRVLVGKNGVNKRVKLMDEANEDPVMKSLENIKKESHGDDDLKSQENIEKYSDGNDDLVESSISSAAAEEESESTKGNENRDPINPTRPTRMAKIKSYVSQLTKSKLKKNNVGKRPLSNQPSQVDTKME